VSQVSGRGVALGGWGGRAEGWCAGGCRRGVLEGVMRGGNVVSVAVLGVGGSGVGGGGCIYLLGVGGGGGVGGLGGGGVSFGHAAPSLCCFEKRLGARVWGGGLLRYGAGRGACRWGVVRCAGLRCGLWVRGGSLLGVGEWGGGLGGGWVGLVVGGCEGGPLRLGGRADGVGGSWALVGWVVSFGGVLVERALGPSHSPGGGGGVFFAFGRNR